MLRSDFDLACAALIEKYKDAALSPANMPFKYWIWNEHSAINGLGYMSRRTMLTRIRSQCLDNTEIQVEAQDNATADIPTRSRDILTCHQYVVHSASFQVPAFYFTMHDSNGSPLGLSELVETSLFRAGLLDMTKSSLYALTRESANFPLLSQGDHPTLGSACWYLHPCETPSALEALMSDEQNAGLHGSGHSLRSLELWFLVLGTAIDTAP